MQDAIVELSRPKYITTGLITYQNRCVINDGGYYIDNGFVYIDITVTSTTSVAANYGLVTGFPQSPATTSGDITASFNAAAMNFNASDVQTVLVTKLAITSGVTIHFIGSYQLKQT